MTKDDEENRIYNVQTRGFRRKKWYILILNRVTFFFVLYFSDKNLMVERISVKSAVKTNKRQLKKTKNNISMRSY